MINKSLGMIMLYIICVVVDVALMFANVNIGIIFLANFVVIFPAYVIVMTISNERWINILDEACDPERFLKECEKKRRFSRREAYQNLCTVNEAVGLMSLGRCDEALEALGEVDINVKNSRIFKIVYHLALFCAYLNMDNLDKATDQYENHLKQLRTGIYNPALVFSIDVNVLEYHYRLNKTTETARLCLEQLEYLQKAYGKKMKKRQKLGVLYVKATLLTELGEHEEAAKKYQTVANHGNGLWMSKKAKEVLLNGSQG